MLDVSEEIRKSIKTHLTSEGFSEIKFYGEIKEQDFDTPCIMIAPLGDSGTKVNYELDGYQKRNYGYQVLYFPAEKTVFEGKTLNQRKACEVMADTLINMRYIGTLSTMQNVRYTIDGALVFTFNTHIRGLVRETRPDMRELEENSGGVFGN